MNYTLPSGPFSISDLRNAYIQGAVTPVEVVRDIIKRAEADAEMNIWITPPSMERVRPYLERLASLNMAQHPLWGIPFAIKDNIDWADIPTSAGCPDYEYVPTRHAAVVERLIQAGAIPLGKTNLDQFATGLVGTRSPHGEAHNALKPELISGGSSSGSAVAVARGHAAFALGTDTAGSGRVPAALNGLVGYKPPLGAWPTRGVVPACASLDCVTAFTANLEDTLAVDRIARGADDHDPWSKPVPPPTAKLPARLLLPEKEQLQFFGAYRDAYEQAWDLAAARASELGLPLQFIDLQPYRQAAALLYDGPYVEERRAAVGSFVEAHPGSVLPVTGQILLSGLAKQYDAAALFRASHTLQALKHAVSRQLKNAVLLLPTTGGTWTRQQVAESPIETNSQLGLYTNHCNLLDLAAIALPADAAGADLPFGVTLFSTAAGEDYVLGAAELWEQSFAAESISTAVHARQDGAGATSLSAVVGKTGQPRQGNAETDAILASTAAPALTTPVAVCGLHMRGFPLERQMLEHGARFLRRDYTADRYALYKLPTTPAKPGLVKHADGGGSIELEVWEMPLASFGSFAAAIPAPLGIGKIELQDGTEVPGFLCEAYAAGQGENITSAGSWRAIAGHT